MGHQKRLLISIPTYERPQDIENILDNVFFLSEYRDIDIVIIDSSKNELTKHIVRNKAVSIFCNLHYKHCSHLIPSNRKLFLIYEKFCQRYEYIWIIHDHTLFSKEAFDFIYKSIDENDDFVFLRMQGNSFLRKTCNDVRAFAQNSAWLLGKMGASIVRCETMLRNVDWDYYKKKYLRRVTINFSHVGFYLERISEIDNLKLVELEFPRDRFEDTHKYDKLSWEKEALRICTQCWGSVIQDLPDIYTNKAEIIKSIDSYFLTRYKLIEGRQGGYYNYFQYLKYKKWIKLVFPELLGDARKISYFPQQLLEQKYIQPLKNLVDNAKRQGRKVYIYGAGKHGIECMQFMRSSGVDFDGFLVSSLNGNPDNIRGYGVYEVKGIIERGIPVFAILSVMNELQNEIITMLEKEAEKGLDIEWCRF